MHILFGALAKHTQLFGKAPDDLRAFLVDSCSQCNFLIFDAFPLLKLYRTPDPIVKQLSIFTLYSYFLQHNK